VSCDETEMAVAFTSIPVIDVSSLFQYSIDTPEGLEKRKGVAEELCRACSDIGEIVNAY
jgi:hypothetical protein